jgi:hypothetical protein
MLQANSLGGRPCPLWHLVDILPLKFNGRFTPQKWTYVSQKKSGRLKGDVLKMGV